MSGRLAARLGRVEALVEPFDAPRLVAPGGVTGAEWSRLGGVLGSFVAVERRAAWLAEWSAAAAAVLASAASRQEVYDRAAEFVAAGVEGRPAIILPELVRRMGRRPEFRRIGGSSDEELEGLRELIAETVEKFESRRAVVGPGEDLPAGDGPPVVRVAFDPSPQTGSGEALSLPREHGAGRPATVAPAESVSAGIRELRDSAQLDEPERIGVSVESSPVVDVVEPSAAPVVSRPVRASGDRPPITRFSWLSQRSRGRRDSVAYLQRTEYAND